MAGRLCLEVPAAHAAEQSDTTAEAASDALVSVRPFRGLRAQKLQERVRTALIEGGIELFQAEEQVVLDGDDQAQSEKFVALSRTHNIKAFVEGEVSMSREGWDLALSVVNGRDGGTFETLHLKASWLPGLLKKVDQQSAALLKDQLAESQVSQAVKDTPSQEDVGEPEPGPIPSTALDALRLNAGLGIVYRDYAYADPISDAYFQTLVPHTAGPLAFRFKAEWYPGAHFTHGATANIGLVASFVQSFGGKTAVPGDALLNTTIRELNLGTRARFPLRWGEIGIGLGWGRQFVSIEGDNETVLLVDQTTGPSRGLVPDVQYEYVRTGLDAVLVLGDFALRPGLFVRVVTDLLGDAGYLAESRWFPRASAAAIETSLGLDYLLGDNFAVVADGTLVRYGVDTNFDRSFALADEMTGLPASALAGGIADLYLSAFVGVRYNLDGPQDALSADGSEK